MLKVLLIYNLRELFGISFLLWHGDAWEWGRVFMFNT
jgi:hypothetical protein